MHTLEQKYLSFLLEGHPVQAARDASGQGSN